MDPLPPQAPFPPFPTATITAAAVPVSVPTDASTLTPPISTITTATAVTGEATNNNNNNNHIAHAANPTPTAAQSFNHPPYADMIYAAITALKERDGSSKRAITKYIEKAYTGLPPTHTALLTHHLKRLKSSGLLEMVKKSYKLPGSRSESDNVANNNNDNSNSVVATTQSQPHPAVSVTSLSGGPKRGRGRPPKPKSNSTEPIDFQPNNNNNNNNNNIVANSQPIVVPVGLSFTTQNIPPTAANFISQPNFTLPTPTNPPNIAGAPVVAPPPAAATQLQQLGKRGPGRPKKVGGGGVPVMVGKRRGRPPKSVSLGTKKSAGRPKKPKSVASNGIKKVPKRLPKSVVVPYATGGGGGGATAAALNVPRPRGRPKKDAAVLTAAGGAVVVPARRPGRPPKIGGGIVKPKKGKPAGRPRKNVNVSWALTDQPQVEAYGDLKRKFEIFQSKVKQAVGVLKPQLTGETAVSAVAELEGLASMDINMPLREEAQPPIIQN